MVSDCYLEPQDLLTREQDLENESDDDFESCNDEIFGLVKRVRERERLKIVKLKLFNTRIKTYFQVERGCTKRKIS